MNTQYKKNLKAVMQVNKNYTDTQIAQAKEEIYWHIGEYSVTTSDDNTSASVKTVPSNATRCKIKRVYGNTQKLNPTTASDSTSAMVKTMPSTVYDFDLSKVEGNSEKSSNLFDTNTIHNVNGCNIVYNSDLSITLTPTNKDPYFFFNSSFMNDNTTYTISTDANLLIEVWNNTSNLGSTFVYDSSLTPYHIEIENLTVGTSYTFHIMLNSGSTALPYQPYFDGIHNFAWTGVKVYDSDNVEQVSKTIDLSTILYNGNPLFEGNSLKAVGTAKDYITPYKAYKVVMRVKLKNLNWGKVADNVYQCSVSATPKQDDENGRPMTNSLISTNYARVSSYAVTYDNMLDKAYIIGSTYYGVARFYIKDSDYADVTSFKNHFTDNDYIYYELATPIEVSINWASTLRGITGYSNGTITLLNTNNMDSANTITYNSIIKENCCAKMVQSRGGSVIKTINFPTQASDGYSAGSVSNVRDFTTNKRIGNVNKENDLGSLNYDLTTSSGRNIFRTHLTTIKSVASQSAIINALSSIYNVVSINATWVDKDMSFWEKNSDYIAFVNNDYTSVEAFKTAMANEPLYYELADASKTSTNITPLEENIIIVQAGDELAFYDSEDNLVTVPTDLTYRIEVAN